MGPTAASLEDVKAEEDRLLREDGWILADERND